ncbi:hypothetical protein ACP70R_020689 [Stipagrostis hirtigluma subsp. patula]
MNKFSMEVAISAISGEIISRLVSFLIKKHRDRTCVEEKLQRLQNLLLRVHTVVEEAEGRYITNSHMLLQLRMLVYGMYRGYHVLDTFRFKPLEEIQLEDQVSDSYALSITSPLKRTRAATAAIGTSMSINHELQAALENLETIVANMTEFVILLGGCKPMHKRPYDTYLYLDNFMFSRIVEKQHIINVLLQDNSPVGAPAVLPVIGGYSVGKKSLVGYACNDHMVRSHFSSILHLNSDNFWEVKHETFMSVKTLVVIEFISDVDDSEWVKFYSIASLMSTGSKVILISRFEEIARFGTLKPIHLKSLSDSEFVYLFKVLAFGGTDPENHPQLASVVMEIAKMLQGLLHTANLMADMLRKNQNAGFWLHMLKRLKNSLQHNFSVFGEHPKVLYERDHPTDITMFASPDTPLHLMPPRSECSSCKSELSKVTFGDLLYGSTTVPPKKEFQITVWESRIPPFTKFVANCTQDKRPCTSSYHKKRRWSCK